MKRFAMLLVLAVAAGLAVFTGCSESKPVSHFVVRAAAGVSEFPETDTDKLRAVLDAFAMARKMTKVKPGEAGVIRYYQPSEDCPFIFYARRGTSYMTVFAQPMTPGAAYLDSYTQFRQELANALTQAFPGRVSLSTK